VVVFEDLFDQVPVKYGPWTVPGRGLGLEQFEQFGGDRVAARACLARNGNYGRMVSVPVEAQRANGRLHLAINEGQTLVEADWRLHIPPISKSI
jgi:hypothetical protein